MTYAFAKFEVTTSNSLGEHYLTFNLGSKCCPVPSTSCGLCTCEVWSWYVQRFRGIEFTRKYIIHWPWPLGQDVTQNTALYPLHHTTYTPTKFEFSTSNNLGEDAFTRKNIIWPFALRSRSHETLHSTLYIMWSMHLQKLKLLRPTV